MNIVLLILATERATELITSSKIFEPLRLFVKRTAYPLDGRPDLSTSWLEPRRLKAHFWITLDYLLSCGYCVSVWVGMFFAMFSDVYFDNIFVNWLVTSLCLHGAANWCHVIYELIRRGRVRTIDVMFRIVEGEQNDE